MASDADAYERGVKISQTSLTPNFREGVQANPWFQLGYQMGLKHGGRAAGMMSQAKSEFPQVAARLSASRPGEKATMAYWTEENDEGWGDLSKQFRATINGIRFTIVVNAKTKKGTLHWKNSHGSSVMKEGPVDQLKRYAETVKFSRPGEKAAMAVEDRFYFGKERFADDAKQIADTILKQLGGGRFIAMTGAKNLAFTSNPPGLHMSIGRGAKNAIKYLRINYDRGSDTYTMKFLNNSGGTVREQSFVHADQLRQVFTSTTGFDTNL